MPTPPRDITLQINLSAGDLEYGERTVSALVATHRPDAREVVVVADGCRPHATPALDAAMRFPAAAFAARLQRLHALCGTLMSSGLVDRVMWLEPNPSALSAL